MAVLSADEAVKILRRDQVDLFRQLTEEHPNLCMPVLSRLSTGSTVLEAAITNGKPEVISML
jgi:hypothetical protein